MNKLQAAEQLRRALQLFAASLEEDRALEVASVYPAYAVGQAYGAGAYLTCGVNSLGDPQLYRVVQGHTSQADWPPESTPALYEPLGLDGDGYPVWSRPCGAHDAYRAGDVVSFQGARYKSLMDGNVWSPEAYPDGWALHEEA